MAPLPAGVGYGTVRWTAAAAVIDSAGDVDLAPDLVSVLGTVTFTPSVQVFRVPAATPPLTLFAGPITANLYNDGTLRDAAGNAGVTLMATDSPGLDIAPNTWSWFVSFNLTGGRTRSGFSFQLNTGQTIDLTTISPVGVGTGGVQVTQGRGIASAVVNGSGNLIITYTTGEVVDAGNIATIVEVGSGSLDVEGVRDVIGTTIVPGANVSVTVDDAANTVEISAVGGGTSNSPDAFLLARANHTGTQEISTINGLQGELDERALYGDVTASIATAVDNTPIYIQHNGTSVEPRPATTRPVHWFVPASLGLPLTGTTAGGTVAAVNGLDIISEY